jgi:hypothetical protein
MERGGLRLAGLRGEHNAVSVGIGPLRKKGIRPTHDPPLGGVL